ncbi:NAD(P)-binding domain-containing protein [Aestuariicoccus sp. MJ-SS9]|uniref:NAD(P)-binding domain-containing protein n=1 Tax=Aestuariicoccus sp. MJ-SS9 TaxID=3079855 RepID=UPI00290B79DA|nr:NAD(P)-binding domain-containing protein [Aestuariicoccus sp. MJ-SS9]MDU8909797.1 NAD(P)-binding domain-containing protein [Aestuariicoccus sp. MJ-SS9]
MTAVGFIGTGHIAAPMARALVRKGHRVTVSDRNATVAATLVEAGLGIDVAPNQGVIDASETVFLCLRPAVWGAALDGLTWREDQRIVSVMAGPTLAEIAAACAPVTRIGATIPYGFIEAGGCPLPVAGDPAALQALFGDDNPVLPLAEEAALASLFAASALVSGVLAMLEEASGWLADRTGDADAAEVYVANLVSGVLTNLPKSAAGQLASEKAALATPNTLNRQMVDGLTEAGSLAPLPGILERIAASMERKP